LSDGINLYVCKIINLFYNLYKNNKQFRELFFNKLKKGLSENPTLSLNKMYSGNKDVFIGELPSYYGIIITKIKNIDFYINNMYFVETFKTYNKYIIPEFHKTMIEPFIIIMLMLINIIKKKSIVPELQYHTNFLNFYK
jgi:hypothetical protein